MYVGNWASRVMFGSRGDRGVSQNQGYNFGGVHIVRNIMNWGLHWGPPILGNYHSFGRRVQLD